MNFLGSNQSTFSKIWIQTKHCNIILDVIHSQSTFLPVSISDTRRKKLYGPTVFRYSCVHSINIHGKPIAFFSRLCKIFTSQCLLASSAFKYEVHHVFKISFRTSQKQITLTLHYKANRLIPFKEKSQLII